MKAYERRQGLHRGEHPSPILIPSWTRRRLLAAGATTAALIAAHVCRAAESRDSISRAAESIHQEPTFGAKRARVYRALTDAAEYDKVMSLSEAVKSKAVEAKPAEIDARAGGAFSLFGGYISGRFIELVPDELIVQAWRVGSWRRGSYSIARYQLEDDAGLTRILFDHAGFPAGQADHLAAGWYANYWSPLTQYLG